MDEERLQSYLNVINQLLTCENGQEPDILRRNQALIDGGLVQAMERVAGVLTQRGDSQQGEWLRQLANQLELGLASPSRLEKTEDRLVYRQVRSFEERFGKPHLYLAYYAAFPLALTPDLLYKIWANFQRDIEDNLLNIPWEAVADVLLSGLCKEVGGEELYEMDLAVRNVLLNELKANPRFGEERLKNLSEFVLEYIQEQIYSNDSNIRDFAQVQKWTALAYTKPDKAARELALALREKLQEQNKAELVRMASVVETLAEPLVGFEPLLVYSRGMGKLARGDNEEAFVQFRELGELGDWVEVTGVRLPVPTNSSVDKSSVIRDLVFSLEGSHIGINNNQNQSYINLIELLLSSSNGEELNILKSHYKLIDINFVNTMRHIARNLEVKGDQHIAKFLANLSNKLAEALNLSKISLLDLQLNRQIDRDESHEGCAERSEVIASIIEKRRPILQKIEGVETNLRILTSMLDDIESCQNQLIASLDEREIIEQLREINFTAIKPSISAGVEALVKLKARLSRNKLNIGIIGRARQGKSELLESLTGLLTRTVGRTRQGMSKFIKALFWDDEIADDKHQSNSDVSIKVFYNQDNFNIFSFPNIEEWEIGLVDLPGLGSYINDRQSIIKTINQDIDIALFVRMPNLLNDFWTELDIQVYDIVRTAISEFPLELSSFLVLNRINNHEDNLTSCIKLANDLSKTPIRVVDFIIANCADPQEVNSKVLERVFDHLYENINSLDTQYISSCNNRMVEIENTLLFELSKARNIILNKWWRSKIQPNQFILFERLFNSFWQELIISIYQLVEILKQKCNLENPYFKDQLYAVIKACKDEPGIPKLDQIKRRYMEIGTWQGVYSSYLHEMRGCLIKNLSLMDAGLNQIIDNAKSQIADVLVKNGHLGGLAEIRGGKFIKFIAELLPEQLVQLKIAFQQLSEFEFSFRTNIYYRLSRHLESLRPNKTDLILSSSPSSQEILEYLEVLHEEALYRCQIALEDLLSEPNVAVFVAIEEFADRIIYAEGVKNEWQIFLYEIRNQVWPSEFEVQSEVFKLLEEWQSLVERLAENSQIHSLKLL